MTAAALRKISARFVSALVGLGPILAILGVIAWAYTSYWFQLSDAADAYRMQIRKTGWIAENAVRLSRELAAADRTLDPAVTRENQVSDQDLAVKLQSDLKAQLDAASLQISSIQATPIRNENGLRFISLSAQASGSYDRLVGFLGALQGGPQTNLVNSLDLTPSTSGETGTGLAPGPDCIAQIEVLHLIMVDR